MLWPARVSRAPRCAFPMADLNGMAFQVVQHATEPQEAEKPAQVSGKRGGLKGGKARAEKMTPEERSDIARKAARARWQRA